MNLSIIKKKSNQEIVMCSDLHRELLHLVLCPDHGVIGGGDAVLVRIGARGQVGSQDNVIQGVHVRHARRPAFVVKPNLNIK